MYELYRNGIVHGMLTNYDNEIVATKAWNRLFAVADWARAIEKEQGEEARQPSATWRGVWAKIRESTEAHAALKAFRPVRLSVGDSEFIEHPAHVAAVDFFNAWKRNNYGGMSAAIACGFGRVRPVDVKAQYQGHVLGSFEVLTIHQEAAAVATVGVRISVDGVLRTPETRWVREASDARLATPNQPGQWRLALWGYPLMVEQGVPL